MALSFLAQRPPFVRPARDPNDPTATSYFGGDVLEWDESDEQGHFRTRNRFKAGSRHSGNGKKGSAVPPLHIHLYQTEVLECIEGSMSYHLNGKEGVAKPGDKLVVPPGSTHTFWLEADAKEDLVMSATAMGGTRPGFDARFIHNFFGYISSCAAAGVEPSPFQIFLFLDSADVAVAAPLGLGTFLNFALGRVIGKWLLGYQTSYEIFEKDEKTQ